jgi:ssDNA-binding Zn-finger/Zn-ribbon topoisomerase 1
MKQLIILTLLVAASTATFAQASEQAKQKKVHFTIANALYTCPTHSEVVSSKPGVCAKCGTKLVVERRGSKQAQFVTFSCPMHPAVVSNEPGTCPKCGKALVNRKDGTNNSEKKM